MCATFFINISDEEIRDILREIEEKYADVEVSTGNVYKKSIVPTLTLENDHIAARPMFWGIPLYKNNAIKDYNINARAENIARYPMFRSLKRAIIPTSGFYEWDAGKVKHLFKRDDGQLTYLAGLYGEYEVADGFYPVRFTIVTTEPSEIVAPVHNRMPVVLDKNEFGAWLGGADKERFTSSEVILESI